MKCTARVWFAILTIASLGEIECKSTNIPERSHACETVRCSANRICKVIDNKAMCVCVDNSQPDCSPRKCEGVDDCDANEKCFNGTCRDVCQGVCGKNAICTPVDLTPTCSCLYNYIGDPYQACLEMPKKPVRNEKCEDDNDCDARHVCIEKQCLDPCRKKNPCGSGAKCLVHNHYPYCTCPIETVGNPYERCSSAE